MVWLHLIDFNETLGEEAISELHKNTQYKFENIQEASP